MASHDRFSHYQLGSRHQPSGVQQQHVNTSGHYGFQPQTRDTTALCSGLFGFSGATSVQHVNSQQQHLCRKRAAEQPTSADHGKRARLTVSEGFQALPFCDWSAQAQAPGTQTPGAGSQAPALTYSANVAVSRCMMRHMI